MTNFDRFYRSNDAWPINCFNLNYSWAKYHERTKMRYRGKIKNWNDDKGYGFITRNGSSDQAFVHIKDILNKNRRPVGDDSVTYEITQDTKGRYRAERVMYAGEYSAAIASSTTQHQSWIPVGIAVLFLFSVGVFTYLDVLPYLTLYLYLGISTITYAIYYSDKSAAQDGRWRIPETTLHALGAFGGWPGAVFAQRILHHKSKKQTFQIVFWGTVIFHSIVFLSLLLPMAANSETGKDMILKYFSHYFS